jgi:outer membrane cobalamin receptor
MVRKDRVSVHVFAGERLMIQKLLIPLLMAAVPAALSAELSGIVVDPASRPVPGASVECGPAYVVTDAAGRFSFEAAQGCEARIRHEGFDTAAVRLEPGAEARVRLSISARSDRVVVSATRTPTTIEESGVSAAVFTQSDLAQRQMPVVADLLRQLPGVNIMSAGRRGALTGVFTRGAASTGTLFLLDGVPLNEPGGQVNPTNFSTAGLDRVEVVRGAESALFGAEAAAGVVQMFSARGDTESARPRGSLVYERGNFQTDHWTANLNGGIAGKIDYSLTGDQFHTVGMFPNDYFRDTTGTANIGYRLSHSTQLRAIYREFDAVVANPGEVGFGVFDSDAYGGDRSSTLALHLDDVRGAHFVQRVSFTYNRLRNLYQDARIDGPFELAALVREAALPTPRVYLVREVPASFPAGDVPPGLSLVRYTWYDFPSSFASVFDRKDADYQGTWTQRGGALVFGYRYDRQAGLVSNGNVLRTNNGGFFHEQYSVGRRLFLTGGARVEHSSTFGSRFVPRGSATVQLLGGHGPLSSTFVRVSAGRGYTEPSLLENFAREAFYVGNPNLKPEKTGMFDAGIVQEFANRRARVEVTYFRNSFQDLIVFDSSQYPSTWSNVDGSWARGVEASATVRPHRFIEVSMSYTRLETRITRTSSQSPYSGTGQELPRRPRDSGSAWLSITPRRWMLMIGGCATGERQDTDYIFGVTRNPGFGTMFVNGSYNLTRHLTTYFRIDNALNERYQEVLGYTSLSRSAIAGMRVAW